MSFPSYPTQEFNSRGDDTDSSTESLSNDDEETNVSDVPPVSQLLEEVVEALSKGKNEEWVTLFLESTDFTRYEQFEDYKRGGKPIGNLIELLTRITDEGNSKNPTALHLLATGDLNGKLKLEKKKLSQLVGFLVRNPRNLLKVKDNAGSTPLHDAIKNKKGDLVDCIRQACPPGYMDEILSIKNDKTKNCLHVAVENEVPFLLSLVEQAGPKTLSARDDKGNTPLHLAVEYRRCKPNQLQVIQKIIEKCDSEMQETEGSDKFSENPMYNNIKMSPYSYHVFTTLNYREEKAKKALDNGSSSTSGHDKKGSFKGSKPKTLTASPPKLRSDADFVAKPLVRSNTQRLLKGEFSAERGFAATESLNVSWKHPEVNEAKVPQGEEISKSKSKSKRPKDQESQAPKRTPTSVENVKTFLKLHYLRTRGHDDAYAIIHGRPPRVGTDVQIFFDLGVYEKTKINSDQLESFFENQKFDDILQRVSVPASFTLVESETAANSGRIRTPAAPSKSSSKGLSNLESVFGWLREKMKVKTILSISVKDLDSPAHSDESIEKALVGFGVETWDWQKIDISTGVIETVAPDVRVVHLYWSGNNAVLRGWGEEGGLKQLKHLEAVYIHTQQDYLNSYNRTISDIDSFKKRMKTLCDKVQIFTDGPKGPRKIISPGAMTASKDPLPPSQHNWIECMDKFAPLVLEAENNFLLANPDKSTVVLEEPIRVALIDDGIDITRLKHKHNGGQSFCTRDRDVVPYYMSSFGHGPAMASQIYRICPRAQLYVLKLDDHLYGGKRQITALSAAQAIREAVAKKVHIISMSWTIPPPDDSTTRDLLRTAIAEALRENILMFCSASDGGPVEDKSFPWTAAKGNIFRIGAATDNGVASSDVGNPTNLSFTFPGVNVERKNVDKKVEYQTGSSVATALATGLAALVLYCVQVKLLRTEDRDKGRVRQSFKRLKEYDGMLKAFQDNIGTTPESNNKYLKVWTVFKKYTKNMNESPDEMIDQIANLGDELCRNI
ncbi:hypothetical protein BELL_0266g00130 [Botrytis elliptica]|uniref:Peptidase S8/S53 domain-containing protein n=1 Tax=Botrytis elliptica TaxID=278938 RepID=A0A4Z1JTV0_9HELO|nr:hypothetical protein EAE99_004092 [Botrytis elliptica]TGO74642.1 hypothetical protein BELL_0266g00130 [Botrytis elliptica]